MSRSNLLVVLQFILFGLMFLSIIIFPFGDSAALRIIGAILFVGGLAVLAWGTLTFIAINRTLPNVSPEPKQTAELVESGIFAYIRHPLYSGVILCAFGAAFVHGHLASILIAIVLYVFFSYKSRYEESRLKITYPAYADYMTHTGRFIPFVKW